MKLLFRNRMLLLFSSGLACIVLALLENQYHFLPHLLIELLSHVGGLLAIVGVLHCDVVFEAERWQAAWIIDKRSKPPAEPPISWATGCA